MKRILFLFLTTSIILSAQAQDTDKNWVKSITYKIEVNDSGTADSNNAHIEVNYFDGLGRPIQNIKHAEAGNGGDIITHIEYDAYGRQTKEYLPYVRNAAGLSMDTDAFTQLTNFYNNPPAGISQTAYPYSEKEWENSPLNRILKQAAPGEDWQLGSGHEIKFGYLTNDTDEVRKPEAITNYLPNLDIYDIDLTAWNTYYPPNTLYKNMITDENNWIDYSDDSATITSTVEYKDKTGKIILKRVLNKKFSILTPDYPTHEEVYDTYYVYDEYGNLTYVIPPKAANEDIITNDIINNLCYQYKYDSKNRLVAKKIPGKRWEYMIYDQLDRLRATGPVKSPFKDITADGWLFTKYDAFNRPVYTLWMVEENNIDEQKRNDTQQQIYAYTINETKDQNSNIGGMNIPYTNNSYPDSGEVLSINYYDSYNDLNLGSNPPGSIAGQPVKNNLKTLSTGTWSRILQSSADTDGITNVTFYKDDHLNSPIKIMRLYPNGGYTNTENAVDFEGKIMQSQTVHKKNQNMSFEISTTETFNYSSQGRLEQHLHKINNLPAENIAFNEYNVLGQLTAKKTGRTSNNPLQNIQYHYNIRGWLTAINEENLLNGHLFYFGINYNTGAHPLYNGNISETLWKTASDDNLRSYLYTYDNLNRLTDADYYSGNLYNTFNVDISYDKNGNIVSLQRNGGDETSSTVDQIDDLEYTYDNNSNRLIRVKDNSGNDMGFTDGNTGSDDYVYDADGNMIIDNNKGITQIIYNHMNLPIKITISGKGIIEYTYDASGVKLQKKVHYDAGNYDVITDYMDGYQYETKPVAQGGRDYAEMLFFHTPEGYVKTLYPPDLNIKEPKRFQYVYLYKDHLGNNRLSYTFDPENQQVKILEENNYYPFGLRHESYVAEKRTVRYKEVNTSKREVKQALPDEMEFKYKYNGKELQDELGLNWYDYGARNYDPALGRFMNLDPLAEQYDFQSPFVYANNNPVLFRDILGMGIGEDEDRKNDDYFPENNFDDETEIPNFDDNPNNNTFSTYYVNNTTGETIYVDDGSDEIVMVDDEDWHYVKAVEGTHIYLGFMDFYRKGRTNIKYPNSVSGNGYYSSLVSLEYIPKDKALEYLLVFVHNLSEEESYYNGGKLGSLVGTFVGKIIDKELKKRYALYAKYAGKFSSGAFLSLALMQYRALESRSNLRQIITENYALFNNGFFVKTNNVFIHTGVYGASGSYTTYSFYFPSNPNLNFSFDVNN